MSTAHELIEELIQRSITGNNAIIDLYADDGVHELPFSPSGEPVTITRPQMEARLSAASDAPPSFADQRLQSLTVYEPDPRTAIAEYAIDGRIAATDEPVTVAAIMIVTESGGRIARSRAYLNPSVLASIMP